MLLNLKNVHKAIDKALSNKSLGRLKNDYTVKNVTVHQINKDTYEVELNIDDELPGAVVDSSYSTSFIINLMKLAFHNTGHQFKFEWVWDAPVPTFRLSFNDTPLKVAKI